MKSTKRTDNIISSFLLQRDYNTLRTVEKLCINSNLNGFRKYKNDKFIKNIEKRCIKHKYLECNDEYIHWFIITRLK